MKIDRARLKFLIDNSGMRPLEAETTRFLDAWMQVRQIVQASNFNRFQRAGLSATQFMTLNVVPGDGMTLSTLSRRLNLSKATLNETVNSLEDRGLVSRERDQGDARKTIIKATARGAEMQNSASQEFHTFIAGLFAQMSMSRREGLIAGLEEIVKLNEISREASRTTPHVGAAAPEKRSSPRSRKR